MEARTEIPPIIETPRKLRGPVAFFGIVIAAVAVASIVQLMGLYFPKCSLLKYTGLPCAFCGGTRSLQALGRLDVFQAFWWNPLVLFAAIGASIGAIFSLLAPRIFDRISARVLRWPFMWIGVAVVLVNWIFVIAFLPR